MIECICNGEHKVPALAVDSVVTNENQIVLVKRKNPPYEGQWALPGGFVKEGEKTTEAAKREAQEETNLRITIDNLVGVYSDPTRDPRGHVVSVTYSGSIIGGELKSLTDAEETRFFNLNDLPNLAFDHEQIIQDYIEALK